MKSLAKSSTYDTMQLIADILNFKDNKEELSEKFKNRTMDWDSVVVLGSKHLMLPALYSRLKEKELLALIPEDLRIYLEEITEINRGRNEILLKEAKEISKIFNKEQIEHVFIKGLALIAGDIFDDFAERMVGDMDILVAKNQIQTAFDLLTKNGYTDTITFVIERKNHRHLPRQVSSQKFGAIELHSEILIDKYKHLMVSEQVLHKKRMVNGIPITTIGDSIKISILALQINDKAHLYGYLSFKTVYDCLALNLPSNSILITDLSNEKHSQTFLHLSSVFFKELAPSKSSNYSKILKQYFTLSLELPILRKIIYSIIYIYINIQVRFHLLFYNKSYRIHILKNKMGIKLR